MIDQLPRGPVEVEVTVGRRDLGGVRRFALLLAECGIGFGQHPIEQIGRDLRGTLEHLAGVVVGLHRERALRRDRPGVELLHELDDRYACLGVARHQRTLDRRSAAPAWEERRMHVQPETLVEHCVGDDQPVGDGDDHRSAEIEARLQPLRLDDREPEVLGGELCGRRRELATSARWCIRPSED